MAARNVPTFDYDEWVAERARTFTGRAWLFRALDEWLADPAGRRCFLLTGEPGSGKSAVAARVLQFSSGDASPPPDLKAIGPDFLSAVHVCSARDRRWINPLAFSESLSLQLAGRYPAFAQALVEKQADQAIQMDVRQTVDRVEGGRVTGIEIKNLHLGRLSPEDAFLRVVREPLEALFEDGTEASIVILVDALDESLLYAGGEGIVPLLAQADFLPAGVRFLLTTRPDERVLNHFLDAAELNISAEGRARQNRADVTAFLGHSLDEVPALAQAAADLDPRRQETLVDDVAGRADGNFLYVRFLLEEAAAGHRSLTDLDALPRGLDGLYFYSLDRVVKVGEGSWREDYAPLVGLLSAAQASLTEAQLETLSGRSDLWTLLGDLGQFIDTIPPESDEDEVRYRLYHQSVADFLGRRHVQLDDRRLRNTYYLPPEPWHRAIADHYWQQYGDDWSQCDPYGLDNLAAHLHQGQQFDRLAFLIDQDWMAARFEHGDYTYDGFLADLDLAWEHAHREAHRQAQAGEEPSALVDCVRYALIQTSINSLSANYVPELVARAVETGLWSGRRALSIATKIDDPDSRARMLTALLKSRVLDPDLRAEAQERGLAAALAVRTKRYRAEVLAAVAPHLEESARARALEQGLAAALAIEPGASRPSDVASLFEGLHHRAEALAALAPHLGQPERAHALEEGLKAALAVEGGWRRIGALVTLAPHLRGQALERALQAALAIESEWFRVEALTMLAPYLQGRVGAEALERGLTAARSFTRYKYTAEALTALAPYLQGEARARALERALEAALATLYEGSRSMVLAHLAPHLEGQARATALERSLEAALTVEDEAIKAHVWTVLAPQLDGEARAMALERALAAATVVEDEEQRAWALAALAPHLTGQALERGLAAALAIVTERYRAQALAALTAHLNVPGLERGLEAAQAIKDELYQAQALAALAPNLAGHVRAQALDRGLAAAVAVESEMDRTEALAALAPHLTGQALERALAAAMVIESEMQRAEALAALAPHLEGEARAQTLQQALDTAIQTEAVWARAHALAAVAPHLGRQGQGRSFLPGVRALSNWSQRRAAARAVENTLEAALALEPESSRGMALAALAPHLQGKALERALDAALTIADPSRRALTLVALAPRLEGHLQEQALAAALAFEDEWYRAQDLAALAPRLEGRVLERALATTLALEDERSQMWALAALAPQLQGRALERALAAVLALESPPERAEALAALAPLLPEDTRTQALERGLGAALAVESEQHRADTLFLYLSLAPNPDAVLAAIRTAVADHLRHNLARQQRDDLLDFIANPYDDGQLFAPPIFSQPTLAAIADQIVEVTTEWRWQ